MFEWIIFGILVVIGVVTIILGIKSKSEFIAPLIAICSFVAVLIMGIIFPIVMISDNQEISVFKSQKAYLESYKPKNEIEDAALTTKKIELNNKLYNAQYAVMNYPLWTFYPKEIVNIKPIK